MNKQTQQILVNIIANSMDRSYTKLINVAHLEPYVYHAFDLLKDSDFWPDDEINNWDFCNASLWFRHNGSLYCIDTVKDDCGDYMRSFINPPEHWQESEAYYFYKKTLKEVNK